MNNREFPKVVLNFGGEGHIPVLKKPKWKYRKKDPKDWKHYKRPVYCCELDKTFNSITDAAKELNICEVGIGQCASGKIRKTRKLTFKYLD